MFAGREEGCAFYLLWLFEYLHDFFCLLKYNNSNQKAVFRTLVEFLTGKLFVHLSTAVEACGRSYEDGLIVMAGIERYQTHPT